MQKSQLERGRDELITARKESRPLYWFVAIFSFFTNLLMLTGPLYILQVYDRVLGSRSERRPDSRGLWHSLYGRNQGDAFAGCGICLSPIANVNGVDD